MSIRKRYSKIFKEEIVSQYGSGESVAFLSNKYKVSQTSIYKWIKEISHNQEQNTLKEYEKEKTYTTEFKMTDGISKKATTIFVRELVHESTITRIIIN